jgi:hypothetical protein
MKVLICGGRDFTDWTFFRDKLHEIAEARFPRTPPDDYGNYLYDVTVIAGGADGVDNLAASWAAVEWTAYKEFPADWKRYGKRAGYLRNKQMLDEGKPDLVIAFPGGKGTAMMVRIAKAAGVEVIEIESVQR